MKIAIVTVNYNGKKDTLEFLESLKKLKTENLELKTIIVDNGSSDGSVSTIHKEYPEVDILQTGANLGFSGGYNKGIEYAQIWGADYFFLINNDCLINSPNLMEELIKTVQSNPEIGLVSPKILFAPGFEFHKDRYKESEKGKVIWYAGGHFDWGNIASVHRGIDEVDHGQYDKVEEVNLVSGACLLVKAEVLEKVGSFDEKYFLYFEDSEFQKRVSDLGFKKFYNGKVAIYHKVSQSTGIGSKLTDYYHTRNRLIFGMRYGSGRTKFALVREAVKIFFFGRPTQRQGVLDYYLGITGGKMELMEPSTNIEYPLKLSIGIVNYNTADLTHKLLESIFKKDSGFRQNDKIGLQDMEVIVLDNGSDDNCSEVLKEFLPKIKYLENKDNEGFSKGYNKTIRFSKGEYFLMLNSDIEVMENGLSEMVKWADHYSGEAVLGGRLYFPDHSSQDSCFHLPTLTGAFKEYFLAQNGSYFMYQPTLDKPTKVEGLVMACFLIPRKIINRVGLLDEGTFIFFEDLEYCRRLKNFGAPVYFVPSAKFIHHHGGATKRIGQEKAYDLLKKGSIHYHGFLYNTLLTWILWLGQKLGRVKTPVSRWTKVV